MSVDKHLQENGRDLFRDTIQTSVCISGNPPEIQIRYMTSTGRPPFPLFIK